MDELLKKIKDCTLCQEFLPIAPRPVMAASSKSKIIIVGQAPGRKAHDSLTPWNDMSGDNLRNWLGVSREQFYDTSNFALIPMGFCFPGSEKYGDVPPRKECAPTWHPPLFEAIENPELIILIGQFAMKYYLQKKAYKTITENVSHFESFLPDYFPLVHPSPRNRIWLKKNPWFETTIIPELQKIVHQILFKD
ncbi:uracil-DNA glycosylase family protein [Flavobacterium agrisoli]|uniref:Uracil-DNA glycosylase family protein n=1 Tax=Flavobacterium agrisoli TaxID=2793066 RepID=A0A934PJF9_9FLAO|nr:uracil-DNA glycosylase family protein [Flavobacterium agrisoli]MBK0368470.1 uracil-DNA glycosylase family protein [Flavobacterium agrisoli]